MYLIFFKYCFDGDIFWVERKDNIPSIIKLETSKIDLLTGGLKKNMILVP